MSDLLTEYRSDERPCPICPVEYGVETLVEPEMDGAHRYFECPECGYAWGYERVSDGTKVEGSCAIGVPESVRKAASLPAERAAAIIAKEDAARMPKQAVSLGMPTIGRRPPVHRPPSL